MNSVGAKVSAGQAFRVKFLEVTNLSPFCRHLKEEGFEVVGLDSSPQAQNLFSYRPNQKRLGLVVGGESSGISKPVMNEIEHILRIPMSASVESLNANQAASLAMG